MPIPTEVVGSLPRPSELQQAFAEYDQGKITFEELQAHQDKACEDSIRRMTGTGEPVVTDGEQRASSFATYPLTDTLGGTGLAKNLAADGQAVIAPSMLSLLYPLDSNLPQYSREQFLSDLCNECEKDIRQAFKAGAVRVSIDFTEGRLASKNDPRNPWTGRNMLQSFVDLNNRVIDRFTPEERKNIGIHTCPGGDCDSVHSFDVPYENLLPNMFKMNAGYFLVQCASEVDKEKVYKLIGENIRKDANGVKQVAFIGVINPLNPAVETPEQVADALVAASKYIATDQLGATDDCGFSPFSIDVKPKHGSPDFARDIAFKKIAARVQGAKIASERLGI
ncbi:unnamed protein product [Rhizoctonia solani]|uniref:Cobalamin-independent methionine synthase MetE C-terminal/archaeal domain-containing protein n=1 Tax=Rhizoctonia solani TaxID=456999 RepID=A0A8H3DSD3_9AGAM|nr:unnamed protein product [Rhizoctonia solani]